MTGRELSDGEREMLAEAAADARDTLEQELTDVLLSELNRVCYDNNGPIGRYWPVDVCQTVLERLAEEYGHDDAR